MRYLDLGRDLDLLSERAIGACIEVHRQLGSGLLESTYAVCLARELVLQGIEFVREVPVKVEYKGESVEAGYRLDFVLGDRLVLELKSVEALSPLHDAQIVTYLKLAKLPCRSAVNFNVPILVRGVERFANTPHEISASSAPSE